MNTYLSKRLEDGFGKRNWTEVQERMGVYFDISPVSNCQVFSVGNMIGLVEHAMFAVSPNKEHITEVVQGLIINRAISYGKRLFIIDVREEDFKKVVEYIPDFKILTKGEYTSSNYSEMILCMVEIPERKLYPNG